MKLKNLMLVFAAVGALTACSSSDDDMPAGNNWLVNAPGTEVYVGVDAINSFEKAGALTRAAVNPLAPVEKVHSFAVRIDPRLGYTKNGKAISPTDYAVIINDGYVYTDAPYIQSDAARRYVLSTDGSAVKNLIAVGDTTMTNVNAQLTKMGYKQTNTPHESVDADNIRVVWYMAKDAQQGWHIDGILTDLADLKAVVDACKEQGYGDLIFDEQVNGKYQDNLTYKEYMQLFKVTKIQPLDKALDVDIHQEEHETWGEIHTTVDIKEAKEVKIILPVGKDYTVENADTSETVKYFHVSYAIQNFNNTVGSDVNVTVARQETGVTITITGVTDELLKALERRYNDGLTVEIHTFYKLNENGEGDFKAPVWEALKRSTVVYDGAKEGKITSAYYKSDDVEIK